MLGEATYCQQVSASTKKKRIKYQKIRKMLLLRPPNSNLRQFNDFEVYFFLYLYIFKNLQTTSIHQSFVNQTQGTISQFFSTSCAPINVQSGLFQPYAYVVSLHQSDIKINRTQSLLDSISTPRTDLLLNRSACSCILASSSSLPFSLYFLRKDDSSPHLSS